MIDGTIQPPRLEYGVKAKINTKTPESKHGVEGIIAIIFMSFMYVINGVYALNWDLSKISILCIWLSPSMILDGDGGNKIFFFSFLALFQPLLFTKHFGHSILVTHEFPYIHLLGKFTEYICKW